MEAATVKEKYFKNRIFINCLILTLIFIPSCFIGEFTWVAFGLLLIMVLVDNYSNGFTYLIFCTPYAALNIPVGVSIYAAAVIAYIIKFYIILYFKEHAKPSWLLLGAIILFVLYCLMPFGKYNIQRFVKIAVFIALFAVLNIFIKRPNAINLPKNVRILAISLILSCLMGLFYWVSPYLQSTQSLWIMPNGSARFQALLMQPNVLAMFCDFIITIMAYCLLSGRFKKIDLVIFTVIAVLGLLTVSKTYFILLCLILIVLFFKCLAKHFVKTLCITSILVCVAAIIMLCNIAFASAFLNRFVGGLSNATTLDGFLNIISTGRFNLWVSYLTYMGNNPLVIVFGDSLGAVRMASSSVHCSYISMIYELGFVGTILLALVIAAMIKEFNKNKANKLSPAKWLVVAVIALLCLVEDLIFFVY